MELKRLRGAWIGRAWIGRCGLAIAVCALVFGLSAIAPRITTTRREITPQQKLPPNTVALSTMMQELSAQTGFTDQVMAALARQSKVGAAMLSPKLMEAMRELILGKQWQGLDKFPGWEMREINPVVGIVGKVKKPTDAGTRQPLSAYINVGEYGLGRAWVVDMDRPSKLPGFSVQGLVAPVGDGVVRGDGANPEIAPMHSESARLAEVLNRLSMNRLTGAVPMRVTLGDDSAETPEELMRVLMASGHQVMVADARYFANFGHLHYKGMDVMMPFWVNSEVGIPGERRQLHVPVAHAEYEWIVRGPKINADVSFYFGIDGKAEFRPMDTQDQVWVMGRHAHEYRDADAVEVTRLTGLMALAYVHEHQAHPELPFGGYYALGVCQDGVSAIERKMTGRTTLFPNTADAALFKDPRDAEINTLLNEIPKDRSGDAPELERILGSLPTTDLAAIPIAGLAADLKSVQMAGGRGKRQGALWWILLAVGAAIALVVLLDWQILRARDGPRIGLN